MATTVMECKNIIKNIEELADAVKKEFEYDTELVYQTKKDFADGAAVLLSFEKYYLRNGSYASLALLLTQKGEIQTADIVASGGGEGILNLSWGANDSFAGKAVKILNKYGFTENK